MNFTNLALGYVATAPSPATTGTSLTLDSGEGARFPQPSTDGNFYVTAMPPGENPNVDNSEILQVTARSTDTLTIVREQGDTTAKTIKAGWIILQSIYKENILDEDDMASNSATALATQQSIAAAIGGWLTAGISGVTVTRASIDDPTVVLTFASTDVTSYIWKGTRIKLTEGGTIHYMIVSAAPTFSTDTTVTCLMEINTATPTQAADPVSTGTISDVAYAPPKTFPSGFPINPSSWATQVTHSSYTEVTTGTNSWTNVASISITIPIGDWLVDTMIPVLGTKSTAGRILMYQTLSTANNSESSAIWTSFHRSDTNTSSGCTLIKSGQINLTTKDVYYINIKSNDAITSIAIAGGYGGAIVRATSTLL
jgi:hypothetical protein